MRIPNPLPLPLSSNGALNRATGAWIPPGRISPAFWPIFVLRPGKEKAGAQKSRPLSPCFSVPPALSLSLPLSLFLFRSLSLSRSLSCSLARSRSILFFAVRALSLYFSFSFSLARALFLSVPCSPSIYESLQSSLITTKVSPCRARVPTDRHVMFVPTIRGVATTLVLNPTRFTGTRIECLLRRACSHGSSYRVGAPDWS